MTRKKELVEKSNERDITHLIVLFIAIAPRSYLFTQGCSHYCLMAGWTPPQTLIRPLKTFESYVISLLCFIHKLHGLIA